MVLMMLGICLEQTPSTIMQQFERELMSHDIQISWVDVEDYKNDSRVVENSHAILLLFGKSQLVGLVDEIITAETGLFGYRKRPIFVVGESDAQFLENDSRFADNNEFFASLQIIHKTIVASVKLSNMAKAAFEFGGAAGGVGVLGRLMSMRDD